MSENPADIPTEDDDLDDAALDLDPVKMGGPAPTQRGGTQDPDGTQ